MIRQMKIRENAIGEWWLLEKICWRIGRLDWVIRDTYKTKQEAELAKSILTTGEEER